jgi:ubiquinone/menaquinone biosynthesis C-methylase UbiE
VTTYQTDYSGINPSLYSENMRKIKAKKILAVLNDLPDLHYAACRTLEVGCSTGINTNFLAEYCMECIGLDIDEKALRYANDHAHFRAQFLAGDAMHLPFHENSFDVVICNHVYEHVPDSSRLMEEIFRVLRRGGICYLAAGNKYSVIEGHYRLPFLSWVPKPLAHCYLQWSGRGTTYYENHLSYFALLRLVKKFSVKDYTLKIIREPARFEAEDMISAGSVICRMPEFLLKGIQCLIPTYILVLEKPRGI